LPKGTQGKAGKSYLGENSITNIENHYEVINPPGDNNTEINKYYYAGGTRVAMSDNGTIRYFVTDHLGSTIKLINSTGTIYNNLELDYQSWGVDDLSPVGYATTFKYTGQRDAEGAQSDAEAGLYFYNARWRGEATPRSVPGARQKGASSAMDMTRW
jgi:hypothetical protein